MGLKLKIGVIDYCPKCGDYHSSNLKSVGGEASDMTILEFQKPSKCRSCNIRLKQKECVLKLK